MIYMIMKETGMSWNDIMWKISWSSIQLMLADAPRVVKGNANGEKTISGKGLAAKFKSKKSK
ncbi:hypothetical protein [Sphingobacterium spiritivorum]|nr:hypothetical protein [Sphingobacterium spiritivorum]